MLEVKRQIRSLAKPALQFHKLQRQRATVELAEAFREMAFVRARKDRFQVLQPGVERIDEGIDSLLEIARIAGRGAGLT